MEFKVWALVSERSLLTRAYTGAKGRLPSLRPSVSQPPANEDER